jgi:hypothetical protein
MSDYQIRMDSQGNVNFIQGDVIEASVSAKVVAIALLATFSSVHPQLTIVSESTVQAPTLSSDGHLTWTEDGQGQSYDLSSAQCVQFFADLYTSASEGGLAAASLFQTLTQQIYAFQQFYTQLENDHYKRVVKMQDVTRQQLNLANANVLALLRHKLGNTKLADLMCAIDDLSAGILGDAKRRQVTSVEATTEPPTLEELAASPNPIFKQFFVKEKRNGNS